MKSRAHALFFQADRNVVLLVGELDVLGPCLDGGVTSQQPILLSAPLGSAAITFSVQATNALAVATLRQMVDSPSYNLYMDLHGAVFAGGVVQASLTGPTDTTRVSGQ